MLKLPGHVPKNLSTWKAFPQRLRLSHHFHTLKHGLKPFFVGLRPKKHVFFLPALRIENFSSGYTPQKNFLRIHPHKNAAASRRTKWPRRPSSRSSSPPRPRRTPKRCISREASGAPARRPRTNSVLQASRLFYYTNKVNFYCTKICTMYYEISRYPICPKMSTQLAFTYWQIEHQCHGVA